MKLTRCKILQSLQLLQRRTNVTKVCALRKKEFTKYVTAFVVYGFT